MGWIIDNKDYLRENRGTRRKPKKYQPRQVKLPTDAKTDKSHFKKCPNSCTQRRTSSNRLAEQNTFDMRKMQCSNCGFKVIKGKFHGAGFKKASEL